MNFKELAKKIGSKTVELSTKAYKGYSSGCDWLEEKCCGPEGVDGKLDKLVSQVKPATQKVASATKDVANKVTTKVKSVVKKGE